MSLKTFPKSVFRFFFPKDFKGDMNMSKSTSDYYMAVGAMSLKERSPMWYKFASFMPVWGMAIFLKEGKRVEAEKKKKK